MSLKYTDKIGTQTKDTIDFKNVHEVGSTTGNSILTIKNNYTIDDNDVITSKQYNIINAIDIDWNGATFKTLNKYTSTNPYATINTTGDLLRAIGKGIDAADDRGYTAQVYANNAKDRADSAYERANKAYELAENASAGIPGDSDISNLIESRITERLRNFNYVPSLNGRYGKPIIINPGTYLTSSINDEQNKVYLNVDVNTNSIATKDYVNSKVIEYSKGDGINIDSTNNQISIDTDFIKEYIDNNSITEIHVSPPIKLSTSGGNPEIALKYDTAYFTTKLLHPNEAVESLTLKDEIINKINSGGGQGIEYNSGTGINVNNTSHTISIDNTVALKSEIPNVSNYLTKDGRTTGPLAVINGTQVNASNATTNGTDIFISSDKKLKDNILDIRQDEVDKLFATESGNMHYFEWRENHKPSFGFIAQELMDFAPETVTKDSEYMQVNYNAALTKTCAALFKKIKELENRIQELENK